MTRVFALYLNVFFLSIVLVGSGSLVASTPYQDYLQQSPQLKRPEAGYQVGSFGKFAPNPEDLSSGFLSFPLGLTFDEQRGPLQINLDPSYNPKNGMGPFGFGFALNLSIHRYRLQGSIRFDEEDLWHSPWGVLSKGKDGYYYPKGLSKRLRISIKEDEATAWLDNRQTMKFQLVEKVNQGVYGFYLTRVEDYQGRVTLVEFEQTEGGHYLPKLVRYGGRSLDNLPYRIDFQSEELPDSHYSIDFLRTDTRVLNRRINSISFSSLGRFRFRYELQYQSLSFGPSFHLKSIQKIFASGKKDPPQTLSYQGNEKPQQSYLPYNGLDLLSKRYGAAFLNSDSVSYYDYNRDGLQDIEVADDYRVYIQTPEGFTLAKEFSDNGSICFPKSGSQNLGRKVLPLLGNLRPLQVVSVQRESTANDFSLVTCSLDGQIEDKTRIAMNLSPDQFLRWVDLNRDGRVDLVRLEGEKLRIFENRSTTQGLEFVEVASKNFGSRFRVDAIWFSDINGDGLVDFVAQKGLSISVYFGFKDFDFLLDSFDFGIFNTIGRPFDPTGYNLEIFDLNADGLGELSLTKGIDRFLFLNTGREFQQIDIPSRSGTFNEGISQFMELGEKATPTLIKLDGRGSAFTLELVKQHSGFLQTWDDGRGTKLEFEYSTLTGIEGQESPRSFLSAITKNSVGLGKKRTIFSVEKPVLHSLTASLLGFEQVNVIEKFLKQRFTFLHQDDFAGITLEKRSEDLLIPGFVNITTNSYTMDLFQGIFWPRMDRIKKIQSRDEGSMSEQQEFTNYDAQLCAKNQISIFQRESLAKEFVYWESTGSGLHMTCLPSSIVMKGQHARMDLNFIHRVEILRETNGDPTRVEMVDPVDDKKRVLVQKIQYDENLRPKVVEAMEGLKNTFEYEGNTDLIKSVSSGFGYKEAVLSRDMYDQISEMASFQSIENPWLNYFVRDERERLSGSWDSGFGSVEQPLLSMQYRDPTLVQVGGIEFSQYDVFHKSNRRWSKAYSAAGQEIAEFENYGSGYILKNARQILDEQKTLSVFPIQLSESNIYESIQWSQPQSKVENAGLFDQFQTQSEQDHNSTKRELFDYIIIGGLLKKTETTNGQYTKSWRMNSRGEVLEYTDEENFKTTYDFDALGRVRSITLPDGKKHKIEIDGFGRNKRILRTETGQIEFDYNERSLVSDKRYFDINGKLDRSSHYEYDKHGRKTLESFSKDLTVEVIRYFYDGNTFDGSFISGQIGKLTQVQGPSFVKTWTYDRKGRLSTEVQSVATKRGRIVRTVNSEYDEIDRVTKQNLRLQDGSKFISYETEPSYDITGRQAELKLNGKKFIGFGYNSLGLNDSVSTPASSLKMSFDSFTQSPDGFAFQDFAMGQNPISYQFELDDRGFSSQEIYEQAGEVKSRVYTYSPRGFLNHSMINGISYSYNYNANGLMNSIDDRNGRRAFQLEPSLTQKVGQQTLITDAMNRVVEFNEVKYGFGPRGVVSTITASQGSEEFATDETNQIYMTLGKEDVLHFAGDFYKNGLYIQPIKHKQQLIGWLENGEFRPGMSDFRGTPIVTKEVGLSLDPFGAGPTQGEFSESQYFAGHGRDEMSGLVRAGARQYNTDLGLFISPDPLFLESPAECMKSPIDCNLFSYARNNPIRYIDPTGMAPGDLWLYRSDGSAKSNGIIAMQNIAGKGSQVDVGYSHASIEIGNQESFSADYRGAVIEKNSQIIDRDISQLSKRTIDIYSPIDRSGWNESAAREFASKQSNSSINIEVPGGGWRISINANYYILNGVCSTNSANAAKVGGLSVAKGTYVTAPNDLSQDSNFYRHGSYDSDKQQSIEYKYNASDLQSSKYPVARGF